jgi:nicotinamide-nucleotide amidase
MKVHIITIGDEILIGQIVDTNSAWMATQLNLAGMEVTAIKTVSDQLEDIKHNILTSMKEADVVLTTGGLGATKDDITKKAISELLGVGTYFDEELYNMITTFFKMRGFPITEAHRIQCMMPETTVKLANKMGTAPGMWFEREETVLISMPGVPYEMKHIMSEQTLPRLKEKFGVKPIFHKTLLTAGFGETQLASKIETIVDSFPENMKMAYLPNLGEVRLRVSAFGDETTSESDLQALVNAKVADIEKILGTTIYGYEKDTVQNAVGQLLLKKGWQLGTAESCTGGNIAARIVQTSGSSAYFKGGVVAYSNAIKMEKVGVKASTLETYGAVSEETVKEMVAGTIKELGVDIAVAVSGIAGPTGGTEEKPVGLIWVALGTKDDIRTYKIQLGKARLKNIEYTTKRALNWLRLFLLE